MTFAQFKRMKPKYQVRVIIAGIIIIGLFALLLLGVSALFSFVQTRINTKTLDGVTNANFLHQSTFSRILETTGQNNLEQDPEQIYVIDSKLVCNSEGGIEEAELHFVSVISKKQTDYWTLRLKDDKAVLRLTDSDARNRATLQFTKLTLAKYYPTIQLINSPIWLAEMQELYPVGESGRYIFTDTFENAIEPAFAAQIDKGYTGFKVASTGNGISPLPKTTAVNPGSTVPYTLSIKAMDTKKTKGTRIVLQEEMPVAVVLFGVTEYRIG